MSSPAANCPNCGAPVTFLWSSAVQTTCEFCHSILVRTDVDLKKVGEVADLPPDASPIQIGTEGAYQNRNFVVVGRIIYEYEQGGWNEWHIVFNDGSSGWLADAQLEYAISFRVDPKTTLPEWKDVYRGKRYNFLNTDFEVATMALAMYKGVEGELPFPYYGKSDMWFADLRTPGTGF